MNHLSNHHFFSLFRRRPPRSTLFPLHDALPISRQNVLEYVHARLLEDRSLDAATRQTIEAALRDRFANYGFKDRKSTRLNSSHANISYAVFCLKKKKDKSHEPANPLFIPICLIC